MPSVELNEGSDLKAQNVRFDINGVVIVQSWMKMGKRRLEDGKTEDSEKWERRVRDICVVAVKTIGIL